MSHTLPSHSVASHSVAPYAVRPLPFKPPRLRGLSEKLLASHYENNYGGALRRLNAIDAQLGALDFPAAPPFVVNGLKREQLIALNSTLLHEAYFEALGGGPDEAPPPALAAALERDFGSVAAWQAEFTAMGRALAGGSGWVILAWSPRAGRLVNHWASDHAHALAGGHVVLALDMYEHAYHMDFGVRAGAYVDAFMGNIAWERVGRRFALATGGAAADSAADGTAPDEISPEGLRALLAARPDAVVLDVRLEEDLASGHDRLPDAAWRRPQDVEAWADTLPRDAPVVAYCVYGFQVSRDAVAALRRRGIEARSLAGGIAAWHAIGGATMSKEKTGV